MTTTLDAPTTSPIIQVKYLEHYGDLPTPAYETAQSAGMDLRAALDDNDEMTVAPMSRVMVPTGMAIALPDGYEAQVRPRSGLAWKQGLTVLNTPGTIDADYRGEVKVVLINLGVDDVVIKRGERIAQMVIAPVTQAKLQSVDTLSDTVRGEGGFGSTGV